MAQQPSKLQVWKRRGKLFVGAIALLGLGYLIGLEIVAPSLAHASDTHLPESVATMSMGTIEMSTAGNVNAVLPVRIADTYDSREEGLNDVGAELLETSFLLYAQDEVTDYGETYDTEGIRAPISLAIIGGDGEVLGIREATRKTADIDVDKAHRWALASRRGWLDKMGIQPGSQMDTDAITEFSIDPVDTQ